MSSLVKTLERFNRKERNWLVRDALGEGAKALCPDFRRRINSCIQRCDPCAEVPTDAWWVTDFHIDWLIGALTILAEGEGAIDVPRFNEGGIVRGNQQDVDLLVAWGTTLILIEAKGVGSWAGSGTSKKLQRLSALPDTIFVGLTPYVIFCSPYDRNLPHEGWPSWAVNAGMPLHMTLERPPIAMPLARVERCDPGPGKAKPDANGNHWRVRSAG